MIKKLFLAVSALICFQISPAAGAEVVDRIVAIVNNEIITQVQLNKALIPYIAKIESGAGSDKQKKEAIESLARKMLHQMIDRSLASQEAAKYHIQVTDEDLDKTIEHFKKQHGLDEESFENALKGEGMTEQDYRDRVRQDILQSRLINRAVRSKVIITDSEITAYYEEHRKEYAGVEKYELRNILVRDQNTMEEVKNKLEQKIPFKVLAEEYSIAPNGKEGGYLGIFDISNFSEAIKSELAPLKKGEHTHVVQIDQGFQVLYVEDIVQDGGKTLEQAREEIQGILYKQEEEKKFTNWLETLKENAHVKIML